MDGAAAKRKGCAIGFLCSLAAPSAAVTSSSAFAVVPPMRCARTAVAKVAALGAAPRAGIGGTRAMPAAIGQGREQVGYH